VARPVLRQYAIGRRNRLHVISIVYIQHPFKEGC
jgi:hypothetical protein